ncbi:reverse transcriptase domain-containing protein [Tanacetum coccineum]|uniref:Reverse transcriptase domain-containing protein n=1 Tax=Tanacetum coccineum TaxID=301880 RepID=A0ABQ5FHU6_9ASTR
MLERLSGNEYYCFLDGFSRYFQIPLVPEDQEKTTFTCPYGTFAYRRMPFRLCNAPTIFQRCMTSIFHDMCKDFMEVFMDDFSVLGNSFDSCLTNLSKMLARTGMEHVLDRAPWLIRNTPLILNKWTSSLPLKKDVVTKVPIWVKLHEVPLIAYSEDGLSLITTQIGKPLMLDTYMSSMCCEALGRINFARALIKVSSNLDFKKEVTMAVPNEDETDYTREVISVEYEWQPTRCADCKKFGHSSDSCPKIVREPVTSIPTNTKSDGFTDVKRKKNKGKKAEMQPRRGADMDSMTKNKVKGPFTSNSFDALNTLNVEDECGTSSSRANQVEDPEARPKVSQLNDHVESDEEVDEFIFLEGDKFGDKFDI